MAPNGKATNTGYYQSPLDIYTAVSVVQPGQTIILLEGTYKLNRNVLIARGIDGTADMVLIDYMNKLVSEGELTCKISNGMITSINGIENPADYSSCWMLYTSDEDNANAAWGTAEYQGKEYGSAISGAETLKIKPDQLYIWVYKSIN